MPETAAAPRIALWGGASLGNAGDRLLFRTLRRELGRRLPEAAFTEFCPWSGRRDTSRPLWVGRDGDWPGSGAFDAVVMTGGVFAGPPFGNVLMQTFTLGPRPERFDPSVRVAWCGVGLDDHTPPAETEPCRAYLRAVAERVEHFTVRDHAARVRFAGAGARLPEVVVDPAFAAPPLPPSERAPGARPRIGLAVADAAVSPGFVTTIGEPDLVMRHIRRNGFDRATCLGPAELLGAEIDERELARTTGYAKALDEQLAALDPLGDLHVLAVDNMYGDAAIAGHLAAVLPAARLTRLPADPEALTAALAGFDLVVASRLHTIVMAMRAGVPVVAADPYWNERAATSKVYELLGRAGLADRHWTYRPYGPPGGAIAQIAERALSRPAAEPGGYLLMHQAAQRALDGLAAFASGRLTCR